MVSLEVCYNFCIVFMKFLKNFSSFFVNFENTLEWDRKWENFVWLHWLQLPLDQAQTEAHIYSLLLPLECDTHRRAGFGPCLLPRSNLALMIFFSLHWLLQCKKQWDKEYIAVACRVLYGAATERDYRVQIMLGNSYVTLHSLCLYQSIYLLWIVRCDPFDICF